MRLCSVEGCSGKHYAKGLCGRHYQRKRYAENPESKLCAARKWYRKDPENRARKAENNRKWRVANPERFRAAQRRERIKRNHGLTPEQYDAIIARGCAICGTQEGKICLDHDHASGALRDALCDHCNTGLGRFLDSPNLLIEAVEYLELHGKVS